ncbi:MAG: pyridoxamine 5'-phosphate oxidase family protein [Mycobacterium sp.]
MRRLTTNEIDTLLAADVVARLATVDTGGFPHLTPLWFLWADGVFLLTSYAGRPHLDRIGGDPRVGLLIDVEEPQRRDDERPNRQIRVVGTAAVSVDVDGEYTDRIRAKYLGAVTTPAAGRARMLITVVPQRWHAVASV